MGRALSTGLVILGYVSMAVCECLNESADGFTLLGSSVIYGTLFFRDFWALL